MPASELGILVAAGTNGAGKSTVVGERFKTLGADYYNPDAEARRLRTANPSLSQWEANSLWGTAKWVNNTMRNG